MENKIEKVSLWEQTSKNGMIYYSGVVETEDGKKRKITLFANESENEKAPIMKGKIEDIDESKKQA